MKTKKGILFIMCILIHSIVFSQGIIQSAKSGESSILIQQGGLILINAATSKVEGSFTLMTNKDTMKQHIISLGITANDKIANLGNLNSFNASFDLSYAYGTNNFIKTKGSPIWLYVVPYLRRANYHSAYLENEIDEIKEFHFGTRVHVNQVSIIGNTEILYGLAVAYSPRGTNSSKYEKVTFNSIVATTTSGVNVFKEKKAFYGPDPEYSDGWEFPIDVFIYPGGWFREHARIGFGLSERYFHNSTLQQMNTSLGFFHYALDKKVTDGDLPMPSANNPEKVIFGFFVQFTDVFDQFVLTRNKGFKDRTSFVVSAGIPIFYGNN